ncbi:MAG TPA: hypothetical protein VGC04_09625 [Cellulomonas sp.]
MQETEPQGERKDRDFYVHVTDADVHAARDAWWRAHNADPSAERTVILYESYRQIVRAQAQQIADEFRAAHAR